MDAFEKICFIYSKLREVNSEPREHPGLSHIDVLRTFESLQLKPQPLLVQLYEFHNGVDYLDAFLRFLSIEDAASYYRNFKGIKERWSNFEWRTSWFPVFDINADVQICLDLDSGELTVIDVEGSNVGCIARHFESYVDALLEIFEHGLFYYEAGCVHVQPDAWQDVSSRYAIIGSEEFW